MNSYLQSRGGNSENIKQTIEVLQICRQHSFFFTLLSFTIFSLSLFPPLHLFSLSLFFFLFLPFHFLSVFLYFSPSLYISLTFSSFLSNFFTLFIFLSSCLFLSFYLPFSIFSFSSLSFSVSVFRLFFFSVSPFLYSPGTRAKAVIYPYRLIAIFFQLGSFLRPRVPLAVPQQRCY